VDFDIAAAHMCRKESLFRSFLGSSKFSWDDSNHNLGNFLAMQRSAVKGNFNLTHHAYNFFIYTTVLVFGEKMTCVEKTSRKIELRTELVALFHD
jgi:hypothetical protein